MKQAKLLQVLNVAELHIYLQKIKVDWDGENGSFIGVVEFEASQGYLVEAKRNITHFITASVEVAISGYNAGGIDEPEYYHETGRQIDVTAATITNVFDESVPFSLPELEKKLRHAITIEY